MSSTSRREFLEHIAHIALVPLLPAASGLAGCASESGGGAHDSLLDGGPTACSAITPSIGSNHSHMVDVPLADVQAGNSKTYTLSNNGSHSHTIHVTAAMFATLATGGVAVVRSSVNLEHDHTVTLTCVALSQDAGLDSGPKDSGTDSGTTDAGTTDAGPTDAGTTDAGTTDAGTTDAGPTDAGTTDAGTTDAGPTDGGTLVCQPPAIGGNHTPPHVVVVPMADVMAGVMQVYTFTTVLSHNHTLTITPAQFAILQAGGTVVQDSSFGTHMHSVTLTCALV